MSYREYYKEYFNIEFGPEYEVHHIDRNRNNNNISNLVMLPKELHRKYHYWLNAVNSYGGDQFHLCGNWEDGPKYLHALKRLVEVMEECTEWVDAKTSMQVDRFMHPNRTTYLTNDYIEYRLSHARGSEE